MPVEKPLVRTLGMLDTSDTVALCGQTLSVSDLLTQYQPPKTPVQRSGNQVSVGMGEAHRATGRGYSCNDDYLTIQDAQAVCLDQPLTVESYNQMVRRFQLPEQERMDRIITRYDRCDDKMDRELVAEHPGVMERAHALYFKKESSPYFQNMSFDRQFGVLKFMISVPVTPETERYLADVAHDFFGRLDGYMAKTGSGDNAKIIRVYLSGLIEAEAIAPHLAVWQDIKQLLLTQAQPRQLALQNLDYDYLKHSPQIKVMHRIAFGKSGQVRNDNAFAWLLRLDYPQYRPQLLATIAKSTRQKRPHPGLWTQLLRLDPQVVVGDKDLQVALTRCLAAIKRGRMDEQLKGSELNAVKAIRQVLVSIFHQSPLSVSDPVAQLENRMRPAGTDFPNYEGNGNYEFCSESGYLGREDDLLKTIQEDEADLAQKGFTPEDLAKPLQVIRNAYQMLYGERPPFHVRFPVLIGGRRYDVYAPARFLTSCPFIDFPHQAEGIEFVVSNDRNDVYHFVGLMPHLIGTHHFFEGKGTEYRVDPNEIIRFFDLKPSH